MVKKILLFLGLAIGFSLVTQHQINAVDLMTGLPDAAEAAGAGYQKKDIAIVIGNIIKVIIGILGIVFLLLTIYAGFTWMTAAGDSKKVDSAKNTLAQAAIGLAIVLAAYSITIFVVSQLAIVANPSSI